MTSWRPAAGVQAARDRAAMMRRIRDYFDVEAVLEVDTPALSNSAVSDTQIESLEIPTSRVSQRSMYLHTSPEFCMKRLLCAGFPDIFSICRVFRDGESGRRHQPEFTMVEWYRLGLGLDSIIDDTLRMIHAALTTAVLSDEAIQFEYVDCFVNNANINPLTATIEELADAAGADGQLRQSIGAERDDWLDLILTTRVAPRFEPHRLTVLRHSRRVRRRWHACARMIRASPIASRSSSARSNWRTAMSSWLMPRNRRFELSATTKSAADVAARFVHMTASCSRHSNPGYPPARASRSASSACR